MKMLTRLGAMVLVCALLMTLGMTAAGADNCYEMIKYTFSVEDNQDFAWLGQGTLVMGEEPESPEKDVVFFYVSFENDQACVIGRNLEGQPESCMWLEAEPAQMLLASIQVAASYEELASNLTECQQLVLVMVTDAESQPLYIDNPEDAQAYVAMMQQALEGAVETAE